MAITDGVYHQHMTQKVPSDPYWRVNCTAYCLAMCINDSVLGGMTGINGQNMRALSNEPNPDPGSPGLNLSQCEGVARKLHVPFFDKTGESWATAMSRVGAAGSRAIVQIDYASLGALRCQANGDFGHAIVAVLFDAANNRVRASDPLCAVTRWYPEAIIKQAAERFARNTGQASGIRYGITRVVPKQC